MTESDREEIRWKFQVMSEIISVAMKTLDEERKTSENSFVRRARELKEVRDRILSGISFGITFSLLLIILEILDKFYAIYSIIAIIIGIGIFIATNSYVFSYDKKYSALDDKFHQLLSSEANLLKGMIARYALDESIRKEDVMIILSFVTVYSQTISYELGHYSYQLFKKLKPDQELFRDAYSTAKPLIQIFKEFGFYTGTNRIEKFISDFEKNDKSEY